MGYNQFTTPRAQQDIYQPIDDNIYLDSAKTLYSRAQQNANTISSQFSNLFGINAYGKDSEVISELENDAKQQIQELSKRGLDNPETVSKINSLISSYSNHPDINAISQRSSFYQNELKKKQEAEEKGLPYYSRGLEQLNSYYSNPNYFRKPEGVSLSQGFTGVNLSKARNEALKEVPKEKYLGKDGFYHERYNQNALDQSLNAFYTDPRVKKQMLYDIEDKYKDTDWQIEGVNQLSTMKQTALSLYQQALQQGDIVKAQELEQDVNMYDQMLQDPKGYEEQIKNNVYNSELQQRIAVDKAHSNFNSTEKANEYALKAQELQKQKDLELYKHNIETGNIPGVKGKLSELDKTIYNATVASGKPIYDASGQLIPASQLASQAGVQYNAQESRDNKISTGTQKVQKITIDGKPIDRQIVLNDIQVGNISTIEKILKQYPDRFNTKDGIDPNTLKIENGNVVWEDDDYISDDKRSVPLSDLSEFIKAEGQTSTDIEIPTPVNNKHKADLDGATIYSNDGKTWYDSKGNKIQ